MSPRRLLFLATMVGCTGVMLWAQTGGHWPQFRGPNRSNVSPDSGLLKEWPKDGPPLLWKATNLGGGMGTVAVAEGRVYLLVFRDGIEYAVALDRGTGKEVWAASLGKARQETAMQFLFQRQPVVDEGRLYAFSANGELSCLDSDAGQLLWKKDYRKDFGGRAPAFGWSDNPLIDGDRLVCTPGGKDATLVALNKRTGETIWKAVPPEGGGASHSPIVITEAGGVRQYVQLLARGLVGVAAQDGKFLWHYGKVSNVTANVPAPLVFGDHLFVSSAFGVGSALVKLVPAEGGVKAEEVYFTKNLQNIQGVVRVGDHVFGSSGGYGGVPLTCLDIKTGQVAWTQRGSFTNLVAAEGHLYCRQYNGDISLVEASAEGFREKGRFRQPDRSTQPPWTYLVLTGGRLYVRDQGVLLCYDLRADRPAPFVEPLGAPKEDPAARLPDAVFVPTPRDVGEEMLGLAKIRKDDVVVDLGCGDGRIPVTAACKFGCNAVGYDIDEECIKLSLARVKEHNVEGQVRIVHEDVFKVDLSQADVVTLYLLPQLNVRLIPQLERMKPGSRIISHAFAMKGVIPDKAITYISREDGVEHKMYLWTLPLKKENKD